MYNKNTFLKKYKVIVYIFLPQLQSKINRLILQYIKLTELYNKSHSIENC